MSVFNKIYKKLSLDKRTDPLFKEIVSEIVQKSLGGLLTESDKVRLSKIEMNWDFYNGDQIGKYINKYHNEKQEEFNDKLKIPFNYTSLIIDQYIKGVFGKPVKINISNENAQKVWNSIINSYQFSWLEFCKKLQRREELSYMALAVLRYNKSSDKIYYNIYGGEDVIFLPSREDPFDYDGVIIDYKYDAGPLSRSRILRRIEIYTKYDIRIFDIDEDDNVDEIKSSKNIYIDTLSKDSSTILPVIRFVAEEDDFSLYGNNSNNDIVQLNRVYNSTWVDLLQILKYQTFSILSIIGPNPKDIDYAPTRAFYDDNPNTSIEYITPNAAIEEFIRAIEFLKNELLDLSGLPIDVLSGSNKSVSESGYSLKVKRMPIEQLWNRRQDSNRNSLIELVRKTMLFAQVHRKEKGIYTKDSITVDFGEVDIPTSTAERTMKEEWELGLGLTTEAEMIKSRNPDLTKEEAQKVFENNLEEIAKNNKLRESLGLGHVDVSIVDRKSLNEIQGKIFSSISKTEKGQE